MKYFSRPFLTTTSCLLMSLGVMSVTGCSSDSERGSGWVKFYNASPNSPAVFLTLDEDLTSDDTDEFEQTFTSVQFGNALSNREVPEGTYYYELAWQDEDSSARTDLELLAESQINVRSDIISFVVLSGDVLSPEVNVYEVDVIDDEDDTSNDLFNLRVLNASEAYPNLDVYYSKSDETFNEAEFFSSANYLSLSDNNKLAEDQYIFYVTEAGSTDVLFESTEVDYLYSTQYVLIIRPSDGAGQSPFVIDNVGNTSVASYQAVDAEARFQFYNGIQMSDLLPDYSGTVEINVAGISEQNDNQVPILSTGEVSQSYEVENGDYSVNVTDAQSGEVMLNSQLLSLPENTDKTVFFYAMEEYADDDGDGDYDEDGDGQIDEIRAKLMSTIVANSTRERIYDHEVKVLNLAFSYDFTRVTFYFVKNNESISTTEQRRSAIIGNAESLVLLNNTYEVFAIATIDGSDIILDSQSLSLDETSDELFLLLEVNDQSPSGYSLRTMPQRSVE
ncbi:DUF4397 domain-containing protein [Alteromonas facilis]|uniref:DUF4397 domain-containing protein n=1 Tax=Alteromonas facilis TaxID=2048004 RepID=UPI000F5C2A5C|nr:DUF4397 domain-containing protein [Alteromonas facilis]